MILNDIVRHKRREVEELKRRLPLDQMIKLAAKQAKPKRSLLRALSNGKLHLICELKQASPSEGVIRQNFKPLSLAREFETAGASAISVLTETRYFQGNPKTLRQIRPHTSIPLLRKDFIVDPYQVYETAVLGADAFLIIVALVSDTDLKNMIQLANKLKLETLVEVHTEKELARALKAGSKIIGINNRNLKTLRIDLKTSERLLSRVPQNVLAVVESGIERRRDILRYQNLGANNFLVGTILMKSRKVTDKIRELLGKVEDKNA